MDDPNFYSGYGFATDQLDFSKYDKLTDLVKSDRKPPDFNQGI